MEKVVKSVNALKFAYGEIVASEEKVLKDGSLTARERQFHCHSITDAMVSNSLRSNSDFPALLSISLEILLHACSDENADVRLNAEESLNRLIKGLYEGSINKILIELFKEIKKNGPARTMKAALTRFADLSFNVRPSKCRPYMLSLLPCLVHASQRDEEIIQDVLGPAVQSVQCENRYQVFVSSTSTGQLPLELKTSSTMRRITGEVQGLIACFLKNLSHDSVTTRRTASSCLHSIVSSSRRIPGTLSPLIDSILDILSQRREHRSTVLGCVPSLRAIIPLLVHCSPEVVKRNIIKIFIYSLHYCCYSDHTIVTSALELLDQLLKIFLSKFKHILTRERLDISGFEPLLAPQDSSDDAVGVTSPSDNVKPEQKIMTWKDVCSAHCDDISDLDNFPIAALARMLCQRFLLSSQGKKLLSDAQVRVSIKTLALECLRHLININPLIVTASLHRGEVNGTSLFDVTEYVKHPDPKLRGAVVTLVATYVRCVIIQSWGRKIDKWRESLDRKYPKFVSVRFPVMDDLVSLLIASFNDDVSTCLRQSCAATSTCVHVMLRSNHFHLGLHLLRMILPLIDNTYWLLRADLLSLLGSLNYRQIAYLESHEQVREVAPVQPFQDVAVSAMLRCLSDEDGRVRKFSAEALVDAVESLSLRHDAESDFLRVQAFHLCSQQLGHELLGNADDETTASQYSDHASDKNLLKVHRGFEVRSSASQIEDSLSLLIDDVTHLLATATTKSLVQGCVLTLKLLSTKYPPGSFPLSWGCYVNNVGPIQNKVRSDSIANTSATHEDTAKSGDFVQNLGPLPMVMGQLRSAWLPLDIPTHCDALILAGNLLAGATSYGFHHTKEEQDSGYHSDTARSSSHAKGWTGICDHMISKYARDLYVHLVKLLSIAHHVTADLPANASSKSVLPNISPNASLPSPMKKKEKKESGGETSKSSPPSSRKILPTSNPSKSSTNKEESEKASKKSLGSFHQNRVLMKLYDLLQGAYTNYKSNLEFGDSDRFCMFVASTLDVLSQLLELATFQDIAASTEEILSYLKTLFQIQSPLTVQCVQQLLKALFGTNLLAMIQISRPPRSSKTSGPSHHAESRHMISHQIFHFPLNNLTMSLANSSLRNAMSPGLTKEEDGWFGSIKKKMEEKLSNSSKQSKSNKASISNYIRLFESIVIKSLKSYTVSSSVELQKHVLNMLAQLVQLRVNYNMLDSDQVFIGFIIKQFESIETGMIRQSESLVPHVFFFLVLLSYEKYHSKSVISMSKIIQLCDGLMASGRGVVSHVIPALDPIVHDLFVVRVTSKRESEDHAQREVLLQMILKLLQHPQAITSEVYALTTTVLQFYHHTNIDKWRQTSQHVVDALLPMLARMQVPISCHDDLIQIYSLFESLSPTAFRPNVVLLGVLFSPMKVKGSSMVRWMAKILLILRLLVCHVTEAELTEALDELMRTNLEGDISETTPSSGSDGTMMMARFIDQLIGHVSSELVSSLSSTCAHSDVVSSAQPDSDTTAQSVKLDLLVKEFIEFLILMSYIHRSGTYKQLSASTRDIVRTSPAHHVQDFMMIGGKYPMVTLMWGQYLTYVGHIDLLQWKKLTGAGLHRSPTFNYRMVHTGSLVLLCDYVCQNTNQSELISWLIEHHLRDVIKLYGEAPVEDFLGLIEEPRYAAMFLSSVENYCRDNPSIEVSLIRNLIRIMSSFPESPNIFILLLSRTFLFSPIVAISHSSEQVACNVAESLLALDVLHATEIINADDVSKLINLFPDEKANKFPRLRTLLLRLSDHLSREATSSYTSDPHLHIDVILKPADKNWFKSILVDACREDAWSPECAKVMACCEYDDVMEVMSHQTFSARYLDVCLAYGISEVESALDYQPCHDDSLSSIMKASRDTLLKLTKNILNRASLPHGNHLPPGEDGFTLRLQTSSPLLHNQEAPLSCDTKDSPIPSPNNKDTSIPLSPNDKDTPAPLNSDNGRVPSGSKGVPPQQNGEEHQPNVIWQDERFASDVTSLCASLSRYLHANSSLIAQYRLTDDHYPQCLDLAVLSLQMLDWQLVHGSLPHVRDVLPCLELLQQALKVDVICDVFAANNEAVMMVVATLHHLITAYVGSLPFRPPYFPESLQSKISDNIRSCFVVMSQLFDYIHEEREPSPLSAPPQLAGPIHNIILHLSRTKLLNSYIRVPRILWKYGWDPLCEDQTQFPDIPPDYLQEKEVLLEFVSIVNRIGWVGRTQFEETWAALLGVLVSQPLLDSSSAKQSHEDAVSVSCLAVRGLTSLVLNCALHPHAGATTTGRFPVHHRQSTMRMAHSKWGKRLVRVLKILHEEILAGTEPSHHCDAHHRYQRHLAGQDIHHQMACNTERVLMTSLRYGMGQVSAQSFAQLHGITPLVEETDILSDLDSVNSTPNVNEESDGSDVFDVMGRADGEGQHPMSPHRIRDGVDVHSCVQFLLDLYSGWFRHESGGASRPLLCECMRSLLLVSDLFTEQHQFEWLMRTISTFHGSQSNDDDVLLQYEVTLLCKAHAVLGMRGSLCEILPSLIEASLASSLVSCRVAALYGALYCLECYPTYHVKNIVDFLMENIPGRLVAISGNPSLHNEDFILALISLAYVMVERCQDVITPEFISIILQASSLIFSAAETSTRIYHAVAHGLKRLVLVFALSSSESELVLKVAAEQLNHDPSLPRATAACSLMVTCMYCGRMRAAFLTQSDDSVEVASELEDPVETRLLAMERISFIFERIRRGRSLDARVMVRILPPILSDFFPPATILNKVIAEFASNLQPYPDLLAILLHKVFQSLHDQDKSPLVHEWVILSLSNVIQRTPLSTAIWCLTCLFICASTNHWINSLLPLVVGRMKKPDPSKDWPLFCKTALDFYIHQLHGELDRRSFRSVFISANEEPYELLIRCLEKKDTA